MRKKLIFSLAIRLINSPPIISIEINCIPIDDQDHISLVEHTNLKNILRADFQKDKKKKKTEVNGYFRLSNLNQKLAVLILVDISRLCLNFVSLQFTEIRGVQHTHTQDQTTGFLDTFWDLETSEYVFVF